MEFLETKLDNLVNREVKSKLIKIEERDLCIVMNWTFPFPREDMCNDHEKLHCSFKGNMYSSITVALSLASVDVYFIFHY